MIDRYILPLQSRILAYPARWLARAGVRADQVTLTGLVIGVGVLGLLAAGFYQLALLAILANRVADGLDGAVARVTAATDRGAFVDIAFDFFFYPLVPLGFAIAAPAVNALPAAFLIAAFVGTGSSFMAFAAVAAERGLVAEAYPTKGIYYLGGLTEGAETILTFALMCLFPTWFPVIAYVFAGLCVVTTVMRWQQGWVSFGPDRPARESRVD